MRRDHDYFFPCTWGEFLEDGIGGGGIEIIVRASSWQRGGGGKGGVVGCGGMGFGLIYVGSDFFRGGGVEEFRGILACVHPPARIDNNRPRVVFTAGVGWGGGMISFVISPATDIFMKNRRKEL